ncbi:xanthine dehydrogenase accessory factor [Streptomyces sp. Amel2xB2]|uniref:XdhC family protein n=1 Tax=Streptomyces sp. Amel2xB2 TaxID=1305829 RepID=UPI000DBA753C|nr:XdhC/CoxI family protein [Streptomyces sp. Amel2xB2]RAJ71198.1 xanthine dehydrogenase accessory factor [Streptomyces sp. Amel2xB2]
MREILPQLRELIESSMPFALATVVGVRGSAPRGPGAVMAVTGDGRVIGSISGGCVEGAVYEAGLEAVADGTASFHVYGIADEDAFSVGLTCGGELSVLVRPYSPGPAQDALAHVLNAIAVHEPVTVATVTGGEAPLGAQRVVTAGQTSATLGNPWLDGAVDDDARGLLAQGATDVRHYGARGQRRMDEVSVFVQSFQPPPRMLVFGAIDYSTATARMGAFLGFHVAVCDARPAFATRERFPAADEVVRAWPHEYLARTPVDARTVICALTHDPRFDIPLLLAALRTPASYIGVMGSRRTHTDRVARLRENGATDADLARLASPIGLDLGARTPEETAVSIAAEIIAQRWGGSGERLSRMSGDIHRTLATTAGEGDGSCRPGMPG